MGFVGSETDDASFCRVKRVNKTNVVQIHQKKKTQSSLIGNHGLFPRLFFILKWARDFDVTIIFFWFLGWVK